MNVECGLIESAERVVSEKGRRARNCILLINSICAYQKIVVPLQPFPFIGTMTTNTHIFTINDRIVTAKQLVRQMGDSTDKQLLMALLDDMCDHLFELNSDITKAKEKIAELQKMIYEPMIGAQLKYPEEGDYNGVREYVESRKARDPVFKRYCNAHTRGELCTRLTDEFGWVVDPKSYGRNLQRH